jgi:hypothetical protein
VIGSGEHWLLENVVVQQLEHDDMTAEKASPRRRSEEDVRKPSRNSRGGQEQAVPPFLNEGPEQVRDSHC